MYVYFENVDPYKDIIYLRHLNFQMLLGGGGNYCSWGSIQFTQPVWWLCSCTGFVLHTAQYCTRIIFIMNYNISNISYSIHLINNIKEHCRRSIIQQVRLFWRSCIAQSSSSSDSSSSSSSSANFRAAMRLSRASRSASAICSTSALASSLSHTN